MEWNTIVLLLVCLFWGSQLRTSALRDHSWQTPETIQGARGWNWISHMQGSALPAVLSLQPQWYAILFFSFLFFSFEVYPTVLRDASEHLVVLRVQYMVSDSKMVACKASALSLGPCLIGLFLFFFQLVSKSIPGNVENYLHWVLCSGWPIELSLQSQKRFKKQIRIKSHIHMRGQVDSSSGRSYAFTVI